MNILHNYRALSNESGIAEITPIFEEKDDCACSYKERRVLVMNTMSSDLARCVCDRLESL